MDVSVVVANNVWSPILEKADCFCAYIIIICMKRMRYRTLFFTPVEFKTQTDSFILRVFNVDFNHGNRFINDQRHFTGLFCIFNDCKNLERNKISKMFCDKFSIECLKKFILGLNY